VASGKQNMRWSIIFVCFMMAACAPQGVIKSEENLPTVTTQPTSIVQLTSTKWLTATVTAQATRTSVPLATQSITPQVTLTAESRVRMVPEDWQKWPVIPTLTESAREIYDLGQILGNNPHAFIKVGDCESTPTWFLGDFDAGTYTLGDEYASLQALIDTFQGSFGRTSLAAKSGFNAASVLSPFWTDRKQCESTETPLGCEMRIMQPSFALVTLGTNDVWDEVKFETNLRAILDELVTNGVVPVLATKADNLEGDHAINQVIVRLAYEYDLPLWNFWLAVQDLPDKGLQEDKAHLTWGPNRLNDPLVLERAWPQRNLGALMTLDNLWRAVEE